MLDKLPDDIPNEVWYALAGCIGGVARIALGVVDDKTTRSGEFIRLITMAMPFGVLMAHFAESHGMGTLAFGAAYMGGVAALNVLRSFVTLGVKGIIEVILSNMRIK